MQERVAELAALGISAFGHPADLSALRGRRRDWSRGCRALGPPRILVNNAGMTSVSRPAEAAPLLGGPSDAAFALAPKRNLATAFYVTRAAMGP